MMNKKDQREFQRKLQKQQNENDIAANQNRARSVTVGTAFGGVTELMMRKHDGTIVWATLQPVEVIELLHQLAAGVGCNLHLQPRHDFASWRGWQTETSEQIRQLNGHPPFASDINPHELRARILPRPEEQPGLRPALTNINKEELLTDQTEKLLLDQVENTQVSLNFTERNNTNEETMAIDKPVNKRSIKRTTKSS